MRSTNSTWTPTLGTYHFPHYRHASHDIRVWNTRLEFEQILGTGEGDERAEWRKVLGPEWDHSAWTRRDIIQADETKVHVATTFVRYRKDGSEIASFDSLYVLTYEKNRWAIKGRSSFAP